MKKAIDITTLRSSTGYITLDPGFGNTGSCMSNITFINGEEGILRYRGYPIESLAKNELFSDVSYLLIYGELNKDDPNSISREDFKDLIRKNANIHEDMKRFFDGFPLKSPSNGNIIIYGNSAYLHFSPETEMIKFPFN